MLPLARIPLNCFFARVASAGVSNAMNAVPDERPLRSYWRKRGQDPKNGDRGVGRIGFCFLISGEARGLVVP
jgi:hypothetical protein